MMYPAQHARLAPRPRYRWLQHLLPGALVALLATTGLAPFHGAHADDAALAALSQQRQALTLELEQYEETLALLNPTGEPPEESANAAVRKLASQAMRVKEQLLVIAGQEVTLLQQQIHQRAGQPAGEPVADNADNSPQLAAGAKEATEGKPLRTYGTDYSQDKDTGNVDRLHTLLQDYFAQVQASANVLPTEQEVAAREKAQRDIQNLAKIPYSADKVRLTGAEGSTALAHITQRLMNPAIPESRRDTSPICAIKTYLFDTLVASKNRSLQPVGKNHYVARIRLQPGETSLAILNERWDVNMPQQAIATDYLVTFYNPPGRDAQLHLFAIDDLLALDAPHIPAWLPEELNLQSTDRG